MAVEQSVACNDDYLVRCHDKSLVAVHAEFCEKAIRGIESLRIEWLRLSGELMFIHCTKNEIYYLETMC